LAALLIRQIGVMKTYGMMVNLTVAQDQEARERLEAFLSDKTGSDHELAVQGLQFLRGSRSLKRRTRDNGYWNPRFPIPGPYSIFERNR
jgi:hypothetical protein